MAPGRDCMVALARNRGQELSFRFISSKGGGNFDTQPDDIKCQWFSGAHVDLVFTSLEG